MLLVVCWSAAFGQEEGFCQSERFKRAHAGYCIIDIETGAEIGSQNGEEFFVPASLQKIAMSVAALAILGKEHRFTTRLEYQGNIDAEGVLHGDIWIQGGGDPTLSLDVISEWASAIRQKGIRKVDGKILVDASYFETALASPFWFFEDLGNYFGPGACGLSINKNMYKITFQPGANEGDPATILKTDPPLPDLVAHNEVTTGPAGSGDRVYVFGMEYSPVQFYRGTVPIDQPSLTIRAAMPDPPRFCAASLCNQIEATQGIGRSKCYEKTELLSQKESPALEKILEEMNLYSVNLHAEHLLKTIGNGSLKEGAKILESFLNNLGIPAIVRDGSGLARTNMLTPRGFATLLREIRKNPLYQSLYATFPQPGREGSLKAFLPLQGAQLRAKTGRMGQIGNLGGYLILPSGKEYAFCLFCNNYNGPLSDIDEETHRFLNHVIVNFN